MILVTGASGMAGWHVTQAILAKGKAVEVLWNKERPEHFPSSVPLHQCNILDHNAARKLLSYLKPSIVVHCAALTNVDLCEQKSELAMAVNAHASENLAQVAADIGAIFLYFSTDSVFDGVQGHRQEKDHPNPVNVYARSKLEGERLVLEAHPKALVIRTNFFGLHPQDARGLAGWILSRVREGQRLTGFTDVIFSPLWVGDLASLLLKLPETLSGVLHLAGAETVSKYAFAQRLTAAMGYDPRLVEPGLLIQANLKAPRPADTSLCVSRATTLLGPLPDLEQALHNFRNASIRLAK